MNIVCVIPARGGSKGIPRKNIADVCGRPLIDYTIRTSLEAGVFSRVVVSTDDAEIAAVARACGAEVPFLRPAEFADDAVPPSLGVEYTVDRLREEGADPDGLVVLFPTHPFRTLSMVRELASRMREHHMVKTVIRVRPEAAAYFCENGDGLLDPLLDDGLREDGFHVPVGTFYGVNLRFMQLAPAGGVQAASPFRFHCHELADPIEHIDIDGPEDLEVAREVVARGLYDFGA